MAVNFDHVPERKGTNSVKWDYFTKAVEGSEEGALPLWVADMDFPCAEPIREALFKRVEKLVYGYSSPGEDYYNSIIGWFRRRHTWEIERESICHAPGVVPAIAFLVRVLTNEGEGVVIQPPVYNPFREIIEANGRIAVNNPLLHDGGGYRIDYAGLDEALAEPSTKGLLFCNPHNPVGRVWREEELREVVAICKKHRKWIISDDIHCDITRKNMRYRPIAALCPEYKDQIVTCTAPTKSFNIAGLQCSNIIINHSAYRSAYLAECALKCHVASPNPFAIDATIAAYNHSEEWLAQMNAYVDANIDFAVEFFARRLPKARVARCEGTYLLWVDFRAYIADSGALRELMLHKAKVVLNPGSQYGENGAGFQRINLACARATLEVCLKRIEEALQGIRAE